MSEASDIRAALDPLLATFSEPLTTEMTGELADIYMSGHAEMMTWGKTAAGIPIAFEGPPVQAAIDWAQKHCATLVTRMDEETKTRLAHVISDGIANKRGPGGLATDIKRELGWMGRGKPSAIKGLTQQGRAFMIARTETASALSQASLDAMNEMGIEGKEWVTAGDDAVSEECQGNEAEGVIPVNQAFSGGVMAPPQHPNAVFEGSSLAPYGSLDQIVRSEYSGPARAIETDGVSFTIGPHHPILTRRGWVIASEIQKGDELLYDTRVELHGGPSGESNLKQMPLIQDAFDALVALFGYATIAAARAYFHGDEVFTYGEVDVVFPARDLLPVLDSYDIEHLCECDLKRAYPDAAHIASCSACRDALERVFVAAPRFMGGTDLSNPLLGGHPAPYPFARLSVVETHDTSFSGLAFDCSTQHGLYNSSGIVVKNCRCVIAPARMKSKEPVAKEPVAKAPTIPTAPKPTKAPVPQSLNMSATAPAPDVALPKIPKGISTQTAKARAWESSLDREAAWGFDRWRGSTFDVMKKAQLSGKGPEPVMKALKGLDAALKTAPAYDGTVYRGMANLSEAAMKKLANAKTLTMKSHTSFSASADIAKGFAATVESSPTINSVFMTVEKNVAGKLITAEVKGELEVLVQKGVQYTVVERKIERLGGKNVLHMILREV